MTRPSPESALRSFLYGGAAILLTFDLFFLLRAVFTSNFVPIVPILAGILTAGGLLFIVYAEHYARELDKREHRRISRVAHQLESPLMALEEDLTAVIKQAEVLPTEIRMKLKRMDTKTKVLLENIRDVFLMLQAQEGNVASEVRTYNLCVVVEDVVAQLRKLAQARNVEVIRRLHCQDAPVYVDKRLLSIALTHVIENAILYTTKPGMVNVAVTKSEKFARVLVQDRGVGISEADSSIIFQPFARGENASDHDSDGIGVGLTLSRLLINEFGGTVEWQSSSNSLGSQFAVRLPLAQPQHNPKLPYAKRRVTSANSN